MTLTSLAGKDPTTQGSLYSPLFLEHICHRFFWRSSAQGQRFQSMSGNQDLEVTFKTLSPSHFTDHLIIHRTKEDLA